MFFPVMVEILGVEAVTYLQLQLIVCLPLLIISQQLFLPQSEFAFGHQEGHFLVMAGLKVTVKRMLMTSYNYNQ